MSELYLEQGYEVLDSEPVEQEAGGDILPEHGSNPELDVDEEGED